jgi:hypothetical protein
VDGIDGVLGLVEVAVLAEVGRADPERRKLTGKLGRKPASEVELVPGAVSGLGVREWLASLGRLEVAGAAFDTRLQGLPTFTGRASKSIRRLLAHRGARIPPPVAKKPFGA